MQTKIELLKCDITQLDVDAVVNAANCFLAGGGGVDGAIHKAAGKQLHQECMEIIDNLGGRLPVGEAISTSAGNMPAKYIIHTVGPVYFGGNGKEPELLANAYKNSLSLAKHLELKSIAFPNISTGVYGYPKKDAAEIAISEIKIFIQNDSSIDTIYFVCFDDENYTIYKQLLSDNN